MPVEEIFDRLNATHQLPLPKEVAPYDPTIGEAAKGLEVALVTKSNDLIQKTGVAQLPEGREGSAGLIYGTTTTIQAFSKGKDISFLTVTDCEKEKMSEELSMDEYEDFYLVARLPEGNVFINLANPHRTAFLKYAEKAWGEESRKNIENEWFTQKSAEEIRKLLEQYLQLEPDRGKADTHFEELRKRPGVGRVVKLY